jgi:hypothetical protein
MAQGVLGQVDPDGVDLLPGIGRRVWDNLYWEKGRITVELDRVEPATPAPRADVAHPLAARFAAAAAAIVLEEPDDIRRIRTGRVEGAGSFGQYFSVWDAAHGLIRDYVVQTLFPLHAGLAREPLAHVRSAYRLVGARYHATLRYHGFRELAGFATEFDEFLEGCDDVAEVELVLRHLLDYANRIYSWSHEKFPWFLGMHFPKGADVSVPGGRWTP